MSRFPVRELGENITVLGNSYGEDAQLLLITVASFAMYLASPSRVKRSPFLGRDCSSKSCAPCSTHIQDFYKEFLADGAVSRDLLSLLEIIAPMFWVSEPTLLQNQSSKCFQYTFALVVVQICFLFHLPSTSLIIHKQTC